VKKLWQLMNEAVDEKKKEEAERKGRTKTLREEILAANPQALLFDEAYDQALIGIVQPIYVHHTDVHVAAYSLQKVDAILYGIVKTEAADEAAANGEPEPDHDTVATYHSEAYWQLLDFGTAHDPERGKNLPVLIDTSFDLRGEL
jgi:hypothetical protein